MKNESAIFSAYKDSYNTTAIVKQRNWEIHSQVINNYRKEKETILPSSRHPHRKKKKKKKRITRPQFIPKLNNSSINLTRNFKETKEFKEWKQTAL